METLVLNGLVNGLIVGGVYALIGLSLTLLYGVLRIVNFAHGEFVIGGRFSPMCCSTAWGWRRSWRCRSRRYRSSLPAGSPTTC